MTEPRDNQVLTVPATNSRLLLLKAAIRIFALRDEQQPAPTAPPIAAILLVTPTGEPSPTPLPPTSTLPVPAPALAQPTDGTTAEAQPPPPGASRKPS